MKLIFFFTGGFMWLVFWCEFLKGATEYMDKDKYLITMAILTFNWWYIWTCF